MSFQVDGIKDAIKMAFDLYKDNARISGLLDDKAQKTGGLAGIFLAAAFGFVKGSDVTIFATVYHRYSVWILISSITLFIVCLGTCPSVMWVRRSPLPVSLQILEKMLNDASRVPEAEHTDDFFARYYSQQLSLWQDVLKQQAAVNQVKGARLRWSQILLGSGMIAVAVILIGVIVRMPSH
jgi:hypothetical protein